MPLSAFSLRPRMRARAAAAGWPVAMLALAGWLSLLLAHGANPDAAEAGVRHHGHHAGAGTGSAWLAMAWHAAAMAAAMLVPAALGPLDHVRRSSFATAWQEQRAAFLAGFLGCWLAGAALIASALATLAALGLPAAAVAGLAAGFAALWQTSRAKQAALAQCHASRPVYAHGGAGLLSAWAYGLFSGGACVRACGPLMLAATALPFPVAAMAGAVLLSAREQAWAPARKQHGRLLVALASACALFALLEVSGLTR